MQRNQHNTEGKDGERAYSSECLNFVWGISKFGNAVLDLLELLGYRVMLRGNILKSVVEHDESYGLRNLSAIEIDILFLIPDNLDRVPKPEPTTTLIRDHKGLKSVGRARDILNIRRKLADLFGEDLKK